MNTRLSTLRFFACLVFLSPCLFSAPQDATADMPIARINGIAVTEEDLDVESELIQLRQKAYQVRIEALDDVIASRLLEAEAAKTGMTVQQLLKHEVESKVEDPSPEEVEALYEKQKSRIGKPLEEIRDQLTKFLKSAKLRQAREEFVAKLRQASDVEILLRPPRLAVETANSPRRGPANAPVTIVEFSDFQCPYCRRVQSTLRAIREKYGDQVSMVYKDLPLKQIHPQAVPAAEAARCAGEQGQYWDYHEALFGLARITADSFPEIAAAIKLEPIAFQQCLDSGKYRGAVEADLQQAQQLGANSTPTFFINGIKLQGALPPNAFYRIIDAEIAAEK